ncbi:MAG: ribulose-phosphate 3-epimerase [Deltaproteobacteria bacterium]|jgi:ribulose-phosphate 3-epimerase
MKLSASILSANFGRLTEEVKAVEQAGTDWIHVDVMDGHFVPNMTIGPRAVEAIRSATDLPLDVHLMIERPERYMEDFAQAGADWLGVHVEAAVHLHRLIQQIKDLGVNATVCLNPATPLAAIENVLGDVDMVLVMTVNPGFGGQRFIHSLLPKVRRCREMIDNEQHPVLLQVDGGVHENTIDDLVAGGVDIFVAGSAIFGGGEYAANIRSLKAHMNP